MITTGTTPWPPCRSPRTAQDTPGWPTRPLRLPTLAPTGRSDHPLARRPRLPHRPPTRRRPPATVPPALPRLTHQLGLRALPRQHRDLPRHPAPRRQPHRHPRTSPRLRPRPLPRRPHSLDQPPKGLTRRCTSAGRAGSQARPLARHDFTAALMAAVAEDGLSVVLSSHVLAELERVCDHLVVLSAGRVQVTGEVDAPLSGHQLLTGPAGQADEVAAGRPVVADRRGERQARLLARTGGIPALPPRWRAEPVGLQELVLAYLRAPAAGALPGPHAVAPAAV